jgi:hypothetical protein
VARILIVAGGCRGRQLASGLTAAGHVVRITTRAEEGRAAIEATGAEAWIGTPDRLATLRGALDGVTILCWLLSSAAGSSAELEALNTSRLQFFLTQAIDSTMRGFLYEACGKGAAAQPLREGARIAREIAEGNAIPARFLLADPGDVAAWLSEARSMIDSLLSCA